MDRDQGNGYMSKNMLKFKKCSENRGTGERVAGQGLLQKRRSGWVSCSGASPSETPEKSTPGRGNSRSRGPCAPGLPGARCTCGKGTEMEARISRHMRVRKRLIGG